MKMGSRALQALAASAILIAATMAPAIAAVDVADQVVAPECQVWVSPTYEEGLVEEAWTETIEHDAETERRWFVWRGGPTDGPPSPDSDGWNTDTQGNPNGQPHQGHDDREPYKQGTGNGNWFMWDTVEVRAAWTEVVEHPALYEQQEVPGRFVPDPDCTVTELAAPEVVPPSCAAAGTLRLPEGDDRVTYSVEPAYVDGGTGSFTVTANAVEPNALSEDLTNSWELTVEPQLTPAEGCPLARDNQDGITVTSMCYLPGEDVDTTIVRMRNNSDHDATIVGIGLYGGSTQVEGETLAANTEDFWEIAGRGTIVYDWQGSDPDLGTIRGQTGHEQQACHFYVELAKVWDGEDPGSDFTLDITSSGGDTGSLARVDGEATDTSRVRVPFGGTFSVDETVTPEGWNPGSGVGQGIAVPAGIEVSWAEYFAQKATDLLIVHEVVNAPETPQPLDDLEGPDGPEGPQGPEGPESPESPESPVDPEQPAGEEDEGVDGVDGGEVDGTADEAVDDDTPEVAGVRIGAEDVGAARSEQRSAAPQSVEVLGVSMERTEGAQLAQTGAPTALLLLLAVLSLLAGGVIVRHRPGSETA